MRLLGKPCARRRAMRSATELTPIALGAPGHRGPEKTARSARSADTESPSWATLAAAPAVVLRAPLQVEAAEGYSAQLAAVPAVASLGSQPVGEEAAAEALAPEARLPVRAAAVAAARAPAYAASRVASGSSGIETPARSCPRGKTTRAWLAPIPEAFPRT